MDRDKIEAEKRRLKAEYGNLFDLVAEILFRHDPAGINFEDNTDEYNTEARTILPRLKDCHSVEDVMTVVHEEFQRSFDPDFAGPKQKYRKIAEEIWQLWQKPPRQLR
jgi:type VI protein secretion system component VasA